ncbi:MAG: exodeoxyribonuclease VII large subunit [Alphaproteobacteria bacterium]|nr:exodeoxyribonuclease VII large subunit [Alphaproteobacteria bacterium]
MDNPETGGNAPEFTVSELSGAIKRSLESGFEHVRVRGELGRISRPASGHLYVDLKDERSVLASVMWKGTTSRLRFKPEQGLEVIATGRITTFPGQSKYQLVIESMEPAGLGALMALLEARKKQFAEEGLFEEARKKPLPYLPGVVGIVTSPTGAVIRDMLHGFNERFPTRVIVWPVRVQGETCAAEVAAAIRGFNALPPGGPVPRPDVLIVARGGGSLEDLWGFNEEAVVRAAAESDLPLISAVGHETDWTLIDLVADARAPTPTKAAEWAVPKHSELLERLQQNADRLRICLRRKLESVADRFKAAARGLPKRDALLAEPRQRLDRCDHLLRAGLVASTNKSSLRLTRVTSRLGPGLLSARISKCREALAGFDNRGRQALMRTTGRRRVRFEGALGRLRPSALRSQLRQCRERLASLDGRGRQAYLTSHIARRQRLDSLGKLLQSLSHHGVLARGFALVRDADGAMVRSSKVLSTGSTIGIEFADGRASAKITGTGPGGAGFTPTATGEEQAQAQASPAPHAKRSNFSSDGEARRPTRKGRDPDQGTLL